MTALKRLEEMIEEAPDTAPDAPQPLIPVVGAIVHHRHASRPKRGFKRGVVKYTTTRHIGIQDVHTNITIAVSIDRFAKDWMIIL